MNRGNLPPKSAGVLSSILQAVSEVGAMPERALRVLQEVSAVWRPQQGARKRKLHGPGAAETPGTRGSSCTVRLGGKIRLRRLLLTKRWLLLVRCRDIFAWRLGDRRVSPVRSLFLHGSLLTEGLPHGLFIATLRLSLLPAPGLWWPGSPVRARCTKVRLKEIYGDREDYRRVSLA